MAYKIANESNALLIGGGREYMTYKIAVCDDEIATCEHVESIVKNIFKNHSLNAEVDVFYTGETLVDHLSNKTSYHFVFLDIELYELNGVGVSKYIRETKKDVMCQIVYISSKTSYAMELFQFQPLDFIVKPITEQKVERVIEKGINNIGVLHDSYDCLVGKTIIRTPMSKILYFESEGRRIKLVTENEEIVFYDKMSKVASKLPSAFIRTHKSYIVNLNAVKLCRFDRVVLFDGKELPISRSYRNAVRGFLMERIGK